MRLAILRIGAAGFAGWLQAAAIAAPLNGQPLWALQLLSLALLVWLLTEPTNFPLPMTSRRVAAKRAGIIGWAFATAWLVATFYWLFIAMHTYGGLAAPLAVVAVFALAAALALYYAAACAVFSFFSPKSVGSAVLLFTAVWTLAELLRGSWFTGFPWGAGGYAHVEGPLSGYASWFGVYGIGAVSAGLASYAALTLRRLISTRRLTAVYGLVLATAATVALPNVGAIHQFGNAGAPTGKIDVALLQGNIPQDEKFIPSGGIEVALRWYAEQLNSANQSLVVTPETALPLLPSQLPPDYLAAVAKRYAASNQAAIIGIPLADGKSYSNSVIGFKAGQQMPYRYDKHHLVPFGEFIPGMFRWFTDMMNIPLGDFRSGGLAQPSFEWRGQRIAPNICYEDLFGDEIGANFASEATAPTLLLNVSNIAWFGDSLAIDQHLSISRMRALEFDRPMVRSTNTGATVVIDHQGQVIASLPRQTRGVLVAEVEGRNGLTPYARWVSQLGLFPMWVLCIAGALLAIRRTKGLLQP